MTYNPAAGLFAVSDIQPVPADYTPDTSWYAGVHASLQGHYSLYEPAALASGDDATSNLQAIVTKAFAAKASNGGLVIPPGLWHITSTVTIPVNSGGGEILGRGEYIGDPRTGTRTGPHSILLWDGTLGDTMIQCEGVQGLTVSRMSFVGRLTSGGTNRCGNFWYFKYNTSYNAGETKFDQVDFNDATVCITTESSSTHGAAGFLFTKCTVENSDTFLHALEVQSLDYVFDFMSAGSTKRLIYAEKGGHYYFRLLQAASCGGTDSSSWFLDFETLNNNASIVSIDGYRVEQNTKQLLKAAVAGKITINHLEEAQSNQSVTMFSLAGVEVVINDSRLVTNDATNPTFSIDRGAGGQKGYLGLNHVHFEATTLSPADIFTNWIKFANSAHDVAVQLKDCTYGTTRIRLPDINSHLEYGPVTHFGQTTDGTETALSLTGSSTISVSNVCRIPTDCSMLLDVFIVGRVDGGGGTVASFHRRITVDNDAGTVSLIGTIQTIGTDNNTPMWSVDVVADDTNKGVVVKVTGASSTTINWHATIQPAMVVDP